MISRQCSDFLAFTLHLTKIPEKPQVKDVDEACATSHRLKWDPLPRNDVGWIVQDVRDGDGRKKEKNPGVHPTGNGTRDRCRYS